jgi:hypothetical protein
MGRLPSAAATVAAMKSGRERRLRDQFFDGFHDHHIPRNGDAKIVKKADESGDVTAEIRQPAATTTAMMKSPAWALSNIFCWPRTHSCSGSRWGSARRIANRSAARICCSAAWFRGWDVYNR